MKSILQIPCFLILVFLLMACSEEEEPGFELLENNELEEGFGKPVGWNFVANAIDPSSIFNFEWSTEQALSGAKSLKIDIDSDNPEEFASWTTTLLFDQADLAGQELELSVWVKADVEGEGVVLIIRADNDGEIVMQESSQFAKSITGEFDWRNVKLKTEIANNVDSYSIFLMMSGSSSGQVFFDDVSLTVQ